MNLLSLSLSFKACPRNSWLRCVRREGEGEVGQYTFITQVVHSRTRPQSTKPNLTSSFIKLHIAIGAHADQWKWHIGVMSATPLRICWYATRMISGFILLLRLIKSISVAAFTGHRSSQSTLLSPRWQHGDLFSHVGKQPNGIQATPGNRTRRRLGNRRLRVLSRPLVSRGPRRALFRLVTSLRRDSSAW